MATRDGRSGLRDVPLCSCCRANNVLLVFGRVVGNLCLVCKQGTCRHEPRGQTSKDTFALWLTS